jgi:hypothetical protein
MRASRFTRCAVAALVPFAFAVTACSFESKSTPTTPDSALVQLMLGDWQSTGGTSSSGIGPGSCGDFQWHITSQKGDHVSGTFSATCDGNVTLDGTVEGTTTEDKANLTANGTAHIPNQPDCPFTLNGIATVNGNTATIPYTGSTCLGDISGTETLSKR